MSLETLHFSFGYNLRSEARSDNEEKRPFLERCGEFALAPLVAMQHKSLRTGSQIGFPRWGKQTVQLNSKLIAGNDTTTMVDVRIPLLTLVLITRNRGAD
jgi:hypothetical protein